MLKPVNSDQLQVGLVYIIDVKGTGREGEYIGTEQGLYCFCIKESKLFLTENEVGMRVRIRIYE